MTLATRPIADRITSDTVEAYAFRSYGKREWSKVAEVLIDRGFQISEVKKILESKVMRWAADLADEPFRADAADAMNFMFSIHGAKSIAAVLDVRVDAIQTMLAA